MSIQLQYNCLERKMAKIRENLFNVKTSSTLAINELSQKLERSGRKVYKFGLGQSPFPVPDLIVKELQKNAFQKDYLDTAGLYSLREVIASYHTKKNKYNYDADDVLVGPGSKELIFQVQLVLDGELLLPTPSWVTYEPQAKIVQKKVEWIQTTAQDNWHLTPNAFDTVCNNSLADTKLLIINSPNNPSGTMHPNISELAEVAKKHNVIIIADEIYAELSFDGSHDSFSYYYPEGTIISSGISKWCGAGGWRLGTLIFPKELDHIRGVIRAVASETFTAVSAPIQYAAIKAYTEDHSEYLSYSRRILECIGNYVHKKLTDSGVECQKPQGGFYMLCDFSKATKKTNEIIDSETLCKKILDETGFAMLPGSDFGFAADQLITRIAYVDFDGRKALEYAGRHEILDDNFIKQECPKISEGIKKLIDWL